MVLSCLLDSYQFLFPNHHTSSLALNQSISHHFHTVVAPLSPIQTSQSRAPKIALFTEPQTPCATPFQLGKVGPHSCALTHQQNQDSPKQPVQKPEIRPRAGASDTTSDRADLVYI